MAKYIFLFCILLSVFLVSGFESVSNDMKEYKELRVTELQQNRPECNLSNANAEQCKKIVYGGEYASKAIGNIATSVSRSNIPSSQVLRFNAFSVVAKIVKSIKVLLPEERHYKIFCVNGNTGFRNESRIFYFIHLQNEEAYERKESSSA